MKRSSSRIKMIAAAASLVRASTRPGAPSLVERANAVPRLIRATLDGSYAGTTAKRLALVAAAVVYVLSPVDLLPELLLPVLGAADDAVVIGWAIKAFVEETDRFLSWELGPGVRARPSTVPGPVVGGAGGVDPSRDVTGAASGRHGSPDPVRVAARDYLLEAMRKKLER
jgi:uncharacterized membrane protein YkvA (DUF1232 family)